LLILSGDIGGTNTRLALINADQGRIELLRETIFSSNEFSGLLEIARLFIADHQISVDRACFGIAGPIHGRTCETTNLPWRVDADELQTALDISQVDLLNDLEAIAWGLPAMTSDQLYTLHSGTGDGIGNRLVIAAGTGLGQAGLFWDGADHHPFASEGGHADFAPGNEIEFQLLRYLQQRYDHVSWERIVSGQGLSNIYNFLLQHNDQQTPDWLAQQFQTGDKSAAISRAAMDSQDAICQEALAMFIRLYAAEAGNHALKMMAKGGVYLAGGIPPKIIEWLKRPQFMQTFLAKGRMSELMASMPVRVILDDRCGLYGPALYQAHLASKG
jgi:glucokinase